MSNGDDGENDDGVVEENGVPPSQLTTEELEDAISSILRAVLYSSMHSLDMRTLELKCENVFTKARMQ